jgi:hypothetical protein
MGSLWEECGRNGVQKSETKQRTFHGKTERDIELQLMKWQQENAGRVSNVKRHPIEQSAKVQRPGFQHRQADLSDDFSMTIEFEIVPPTPRGSSR